jgi:DNA-binding NarL/FixJ family response regulator
MLRAAEGVGRLTIIRSYERLSPETGSTRRPAVTMIRVVVADDHTILREGLKGLLRAAGDIEIAGEAADGTEVLQRIRGPDFDVLLLDMSMPGKSGTELIRQVKAERPRLRILVLSMHEEHQYAVRAIKAGASGYLTKESASAQLVTAIRRVAAGGAFVSAEVAEQLALSAMPAAEGPPHETLSDREYQVFQRLVAGTSVTDIATELNLSSKTVSTHKARLMEKLGVTNSAELFRYAMRHRLASPSEPPP